MPRTLALLAALTLGVPAARADKAPPAAQPGQLDVFDEAKLFSQEGIDRAKEAFRKTEFHYGLAVTVDTVTAPPAGKRAEAEAAHRDEAKWRGFLTAWARDTAKADRAKGVYVLVTLQPVGGIAVLADAQTTRRGFSADDDRTVREIFAAAFKEAKGEPDEAKKQAVRSAALLKAVEYIAADLKDTRVADASGEERKEHGPAHPNAPPSPVMGYVCLGLCVLAGAWLMIALVRAFTGGGGGGGGGMGGGGGGFFPSLLGGLFGAAAGMWMYSHFFGGGGGGLFGGGSDAHAGDAGDSMDVGGDTGAGDWGGGSADAGGFDGGGGDFGGGDFGGDF
ncbi:MAG: hypothetical protein U0804_02050 [Gemmataceae bacterium]